MGAPRPIGYWLRLVDRLIDERFDDLLVEHGVTRRQWQLLNVLAAGGATLSALDAAVAPFLDDGAGESSAEHLAELVESGWVGEADGRYELLPRGRTVFERLGVEVDELRAAVAEGVTAEEHAQVVAVLERMARNLGWDDAGAP